MGTPLHGDKAGEPGRGGLPGYSDDDDTKQKEKQDPEGKGEPRTLGVIVSILAEVGAY